jgi:hypothetical protein
MSALGTEYKYGIRMSPIGDIHLEECEFEVKTYIFSNKGVIFKKGDERHIKKIDADSYAVVVDKENALKIGKGVVVAEVTLHIPDADFDDGFRTEVIDGICTGIVIK